jgi:threonine synthase
LQNQTETEKLRYKMQYYSTNKKTPDVSLQEAVVKGLAADKGLFMPREIKQLPATFFSNIKNLSFQEIAYTVADAFFGEDVDAESLKQIVYDALSFDVPLVNVNDNINSLELFHGPTLAFKDVGGRFMSRLLGYFIKKQSQQQVNVLVATSGDTGSAVANGFLGVPGIHVYVLYPKGKVSKIQESQFTTLGQNITALEVDGVFDDCQALVKSAFMDADLNKKMKLTSANSINVARFLPQAFYYFYAYAQLQKQGKDKNVVICVPSGNFGNITAGLFGKRMGLPISRFIAANNRNDVFFEYLKTGEYKPRPSVQTIANAMDVGDPSNFARVLDLYGHSHEAICKDISGCTYNDDQIRTTIKEVFGKYHYLLDPHGAVGYQALAEHIRPEENGVFLETAHPAKFRDTVEPIVGKVEIPAKLQAFMRGTKQSIELPKDFASFKNYLMNV